MEGAARYTIDMGWGLMLNNLGIRPADLLRQARLPLDLFQRKTAQVTSAEYFRLWSAIETVSGDPLVPIRLVGEMTAETFSPALFACLCSESLDAALTRLSHFKPLVGPMRLRITKGPTETVAEIAGLPADMPAPAVMLAGELAFFTQLARLGLQGPDCARLGRRPGNLSRPRRLCGMVRLPSASGRDDPHRVSPSGCRAPVPDRASRHVGRF